MNIFVLSTGRCGSTTFSMACESMNNYTVAHESERRRDYGQFRHRYQTLQFPDNHIEIDNRLTWFLGAIDEIYSSNAFYVHLMRDREEVAKSHLGRWKQHKTNIIYSFAWGILTHPRDQIEQLSDDDRLEIGRQYWDTVNSNIHFFLKDKPLQSTMWLHEIKPGFEKFWHSVGAEGDLDSALAFWDTAYNSGSKAPDFADSRLPDLIAPNSTCIVVDDGKLEPGVLKNIKTVPFTERDGEYWGPPESTSHAIVELERLRAEGATSLAFISYSFWWLEHYPGFKQYLDENYVCTLSAADLLIYDLHTEK